MKTHEGPTLNVYYYVKEGNLKSLSTEWLELYDILEKRKTLRQ